MSCTSIPSPANPSPLLAGITTSKTCARCIFFSNRYVENVPLKPFDPVLEIYSKRNIRFIGPRYLRSVREVLDVGDWNDTWDRSFQFRSPIGKVTLTQHLLLLTPHFAWAVATPHNNPFLWNAGYRTSEMDRATVIALLAATSI